MSKAKVEKSVGKLMQWLPDYDWKNREQMLKALGAFLGDLPGGDEWEGMGYETYGFSWHEVELVSDVICSVDDSRDNEYVTDVLFAQEEEEEEEEEEEDE